VPNAGHQAPPPAVACMPLLCASPFRLTAVSEPSDQDQQKHTRGDATSCGVHKQEREALDSDSVPIVETEADIACCQGAQAAVLRNSKLSRLKQSRERLAASVDLYSIFTFGERDQHGVRGPPDVAAPREFPVERERGDKEQDQA